MASVLQVSCNPFVWRSSVVCYEQGTSSHALYPTPQPFFAHVQVH